MKYYELTEVKEALDNAGIKYKEVRINDAIFVYVDGLMQIGEPTQEQRNEFWPEVRISLHDFDEGYYVRACGMIYEDRTISDIIKIIHDYI